MGHMLYLVCCHLHAAENMGPMLNLVCCNLHVVQNMFSSCHRDTASIVLQSRRNYDTMSVVIDPRWTILIPNQMCLTDPMQRQITSVHCMQSLPLQQSPPDTSHSTMARSARVSVVVVSSPIVTCYRVLCLGSLNLQVCYCCQHLIDLYSVRMSFD